MSVEYLAATLHAPVSPPARKLVLIGLANHADHAGRCWPSVAALASIAGLDTRSVRRHLNALEDAGWIERVPQYSDGRQVTNVYRVTPQAIESGQAPGVTHTTPREDTSVTPGGQQRQGEGDTSDTPGADTSDTPGADTSVRGNRHRNRHRNRQGNPSTSESASRVTDAAGGSETEPVDAGQLTLTPEEPDPTFLRVPARGGHVDIPESKVREWEQAYPALDVRAELRGLAQWAEDNPARRKKNVISWCSRRLSAKQESGRGIQRAAPAGGGKVTPHPRSAEAIRQHNAQVAHEWAKNGR